MSTMLLAIIFIPLCLFFIFTPYLTRKTESFGVSIPEKIYYTTEMKRMRKQYAMVTGAMSIFILGSIIALSLFKFNDNLANLLIVIIIVGTIMMHFLIYYFFHRIMKRKKQAVDWKNDRTEKIFIHMKFHNQQLRYSNKWFIIPFVAFLTTITITYYFYDKLPQELAINYDLLGNGTNFVTKSYISALALPITQLFLLSLFLGVNILIGKVKQQISAENPKKSLQQNVMFRRRWSAFIVLSGVLLTLLLFLGRLAAIFPNIQPVYTIATIAINLFLFIGAVFLVFSTGQSGSRIKLPDERNEAVIDRDDDRYWKLGQFYVNKNDPAIFLEKRFGIGWTINLGKPLSWIIMFIFLLVILGLVLLTH
ncbi:MAG: DUF5808 domain-containing protein [Virgibacillus proomii]|jgi:uncharacterized membrane protein